MSICRNRCHLANKYEYIVNLQGAEAYCVATRTACCSCRVVVVRANSYTFRKLLNLRLFMLSFHTFLVIVMPRP